MIEDWKTYKLSEVTDFIGRGISPKYIEVGGVQVINQRCIRNNKIIFETCRFHDLSRKGITDKKYVQKFDVLVNSTGVGTLGRVAQYKNNNKKISVDSHVSIVRPKPEFCDEYFGYAVVGNQKRIEALGEGSTGQTELSRIRLGEEVIISIPDSKVEREAIASILSALDDKIELNLQMNKTLEDMAMTLYKHWFVDFGPFQEGEMVDSELGEIPKGWEVKRLGEYCNKSQYGYTQSSSLEEVGPKFLRITDIQGGFVEWKNVPYCIANEKAFNKYKIVKGDLLVARTGNSTGENVYVLNAPKSVFASYLIRFQFDELYKAAYVAKIFRSKQFFNFIDGAKVGSAQPGISASALGEFRLVIPTENLLKDFFQIINNYDEKKEANLIENQTLTKLRDTLLPKLISGEVRVKEAENIITQAL